LVRTFPYNDIIANKHTNKREAEMTNQYAIQNQYYRINETGEWEFVVELSRIKAHMGKAESVTATFGTFETVGKSVVYTNYRGTIQDCREDIGNLGFITSEFVDDLNQLFSQEVTVNY
jgi:hypothetical protein